MSIFRFTNSPFEDILQLQRALERSISAPFWHDWVSGRGVYPPVNVFEKDDALIVKAEVPGFDKKSFSIEIEGNRLMLTGQRETRPSQESCSYHRREREQGEFRRVLRLPYAVDREKAKATYTDGVLTINLEKAEAAKRHKVAIGD